MPRQEEVETGFTGLTGWTFGSKNHHLLESLQFSKKTFSILFILFILSKSGASTDGCG
jgi:hypothetical protein